MESNVPEKDHNGTEDDNNKAKKGSAYAKKKEAIIEELKTEEKYARYFAQFNPSGIDKFINDYSFYKELWWQYGENYIRQNEANDMTWVNKAHLHLEIIQHKKLFDAQCRWHAEQVTFPGVEICHDFVMWGKNVLHCPFIEPINQDDIKLYIDYLKSNYVEENFEEMEDLQDYDVIKDTAGLDEDDEDFPSWYAFHNRHTGNAEYLFLPDIKGDKEDYYIKLYYAKKNEANKEEHEKAEEARDKRPFLGIYDREKVDSFVKELEDKKTQQYYEAFQRKDREHDAGEEMRHIINVLALAEEPVPIEANEDYREALRKAYLRYNAKMIAAYLPFAYEEYSMKKNMGFGQAEEDKAAMKSEANMRKYWYDCIIEGRKINGEPADLNF